VSRPTKVVIVPYEVNAERVCFVDQLAHADESVFVVADENEADKRVFVVSSHQPHDRKVFRVEGMHGASVLNAYREPEAPAEPARPVAEPRARREIHFGAIPGALFFSFLLVWTLAFICFGYGRDHAEHNGAGCVCVGMAFAAFVVSWKMVVR
jgi:hypothetical protein